MAVPVVGFPLVTLARVIGVLVLALVLTWNVHYRGGLAIINENKDLIFNLLNKFAQPSVDDSSPEKFHEKDLSAKMLALLAYKSVSGTKSFKKQAWKFHIDKGIDNFYSLHSWLGLACLFLFVCQWLIGCTTFLYPGGSRNRRSVVLPWHVFFGIFIYALAISTAARDPREAHIPSKQQGLEGVQKCQSQCA
ncbi:hypothetical protein Scep_022447 [Stephania cephalantha]|uniref:Cytochrome b561 domain-containing protein n=1 Tax=Stephania cephalantha TaxID=152367 RepID=A0AAP0FAG1_9MAGN